MKTVKLYKTLRVAWALLCASIDIAILVIVTTGWANAGNPWWSIFIASVNYTIGAIAIWWFVDDILEYAQRQNEDDLYYKSNKR